MPGDSVDIFILIQSHPRKRCIKKHVKFYSGVIKQNLTICFRKDLDNPGKVLLYFCIKDNTSSGSSEVV